MSLNWDISSVEDYKTKCYIPDPEDPEKVLVHPVTESLVWLSMAVHMNEITKENCEEFYRRVSIIEMVNGTYLSNKHNDGTVEPLWMTLSAIKSHIGLRTNVTSHGWSKYSKAVMGMLRAKAERRLSEEKKSLEQKQEVDNG